MIERISLLESQLSSRSMAMRNRPGIRPKECPAGASEGRQQAATSRWRAALHRSAEGGPGSIGGLVENQHRMLRNKIDRILYPSGRNCGFDGCREDTRANRLSLERLSLLRVMRFSPPDGPASGSFQKRRPRGHGYRLSTLGRERPHLRCYDKSSNGYLATSEELHSSRKRDGLGFRGGRLGASFGPAQHDYEADERADGNHVAVALASV